MEKQSQIPALKWLLEPDDAGVRYLALRDLVRDNKKELEEARSQAHSKGPISAILDKMNKAGYWVQPGSGYYPKYTGTVWSIILLAQLGASVKADERVAIACSYILDHTLTKGGHFSMSNTASATIDCLQGNLCTSLLDLGCNDSRLNKAFEWMARSITGEGVAPLTCKTATVRYYAGKCGPNFACGANNKLPCAWGAVKVMGAFSRLPKSKHSKLIDKAIAAGVQFLFSTDPAKADYPSGYSAKPSGNWWKFGFPVFYVSDIMEIADALIRLGYGKDPRLANTLKIIREKQDKQGRWCLEYDYTGKTWADFGKRKLPNKWVTLRALRVLNAVR
jgi:hypothetical protein